MTTPKADELARQLDQAVQAGALADFKKASTGDKLKWTIVRADGHGTLTLESREVHALLLGIGFGRAAGRAAKPHPIRDVIVADGRVVVDIDDPNDSTSLKRQRNGLFGHAYALGLKGRFTVKREGDKLIGEVTE